MSLEGKIVRIKGVEPRRDVYGIMHGKFEGSTIEVTESFGWEDDMWWVRDVDNHDVKNVVRGRFLLECLDSSTPRNVRIPLAGSGGDGA